MNARLVWDGVELFVPPEMGKPKEGQLVGTPLEQLGEVACRICYDSLGVGRPSDQLHKHILDVDNSSVYEHCTFTVGFYVPAKISKFIRNFVNRKGVWVESKFDVVEVTVNFRTVLEWDKYTSPVNKGLNYEVVAHVLKTYAHQLAPQIFSQPINPTIMFTNGEAWLCDGELNDDQIWISMWVRGSRGFSHELVRHRFAMSQRSTRYVDESESPYIEHPLITQYLNDEHVLTGLKDDLKRKMRKAIEEDREVYRTIEQLLIEYNLQRLGKKVFSREEKTAAQKQARGAARENLGNALETQLIFSAPISGWKWMLQKRASRFADAEIRGVFCEVLEELKKSRWGARFNDYNLEASPDGLGMVLQGY